MRTSSAKAKGRRLQQLVRDVLRRIGAKHGLVDEDIESRGMGQNGEDVILSPAAKKIFNFAIECKNCEKLNVPKVFQKHFEKYPDASMKLLVHCRNHAEPLVTLRLEDLAPYLDKFNGPEKEL